MSFVRFSPDSTYIETRVQGLFYLLPSSSSDSRCSSVEKIHSYLFIYSLFAVIATAAFRRALAFVFNGRSHTCVYNERVPLPRL